MRDAHRDPTDHFRTTQQHAGEHMIDGYYLPGLLLIAVGVVALTGAVAAAAYKHPATFLAALVIAVVGIAVGAAWLAVEHRRVRRVETQWLAEHPGRYTDSRPRSA